MRCLLSLTVLGLVALPVPVGRAQTADEVTTLINRIIDLDSIDIAKDIKFRAGLEPPLYALDADESEMKVLKDPYEVFGKNKAGAAGWYRVRFTVPEKIGKFPIPKNGFNMGVESNCLGSWEIYTYSNGKPVGSTMAAGVPGSVLQGNVVSNARQHPTAWMSNAPIPTKAGDKITVAILATATPLGRGSPDGFALRHLRLRFALGHTFTRQPFFGSVTGTGQGTGLLGAREMLSTLKGDELKALQEKLKGPLSRTDTLFKAAETEQLEELTKAMKVLIPEINAAVKK